jgi:hypothetical protein
VTTDLVQRLNASRQADEHAVRHSFDLHGELDIFDLLRNLRPDAVWRHVHDGETVRIAAFDTQPHHGPRAVGDTSDQAVRHCGGLLIVLDGYAPASYFTGPGPGLRLAALLEHYRPANEAAIDERNPTAAEGDR